MAQPTGHPRRWWILSVLVLSLLVVGLDTLILNVALPTLQRDLGATGSDLQWTVDSYSLAFGGLLLLAGGLGDRFGRRLVLAIGLVLFGATSVVAALSTSIDALIAARVGMGVGAALIMPATLSIIKTVFPPAEQGRAIAIWAGGASVGIPLGPVIGGLLLERYSWASVFWINVPVVIVALVAGLVLIPEFRDSTGALLDLPGALLSTAGLATLVYAIIEAPVQGWTSATTLGSVAASAALLAGFWVWQHRTASPLLPPSLMRNRRVGGSVLVITVLAFALYGILFCLTQYLQFVLRYEPLEAGLRLLPIIAIVVAAPLGVVLVRRAGFHRTAALGIAAVAIGAGLVASLDVDTPNQALFAVAAIGVGLGFALPPASDAILAATPPDKAGVGSALTDAALQIGGSLGVAVLGSVLVDEYRDAVSPALTSVPEPAAGAVADSVAAAQPVSEQLPAAAGDSLLAAVGQAFVDGQQAAMIVAVIVATIGIALARMLLPRSVSEPAALDADGSSADLPSRPSAMDSPATGHPTSS
jgi:EmrB/QacA subfamily drug resistance transporter